MDETLTPSQPEELVGVLPENQVAAELVEAQAAVANGTATHEQQLAVSSFEVGAEHGQETAITTLDQKSVEERTKIDDPVWLNSTEATIAAWPSVDTARKPFGEPKKKSDRELRGYEDIRDYLLRSRTEAEATPDEDVHYDETMGKTNQEMTERQLVKKWAKAEDDGDKTVSTDVQNEIQERLLAKRGNEDKKLEKIDKLHSDMTKLRKNIEVKVDSSNEAEKKELLEQLDRDMTEVAKKLQSESTTQNDETKAQESIDEGDVEKLELGNAKLGNVDKIIAQKAKEIVEQEKADVKNAKGIRGFIKKIATGIKYSALFAEEAERGIGLRLKAKVLSEIEANGGIITPNQFLTKIGYPVSELDSASKAMLTALTEEIFRREGDSVISIDEHNHDYENSEQFWLSVDAESITHEFVEAVSQPGLSLDEIAKIKEDYRLILDGRFADFRSKGENYSTSDLEVATSNAAKILESCWAVLGHDNGREKVNKMIDQMTVNIGNINYGANNNLDTKYLETTAARIKARDTSSVLIKGGIVVASWVGTGALATSLTQQLSTKGAKIFGASIGGALLGPAGAIIGIGAGAAVSAAYARHYGRKRANESVNLASITAGEAGSRDDNEILRDLAPTTRNFGETTTDLQSFMTRESEDSEWQLKPGLTKEQVLMASALIADTGNRLATEAQSNVGNVSLNLFESTNKASYNSERISMIQAQKALEGLIVSEFGGKTIEISIIKDGQETTQEIEFDQAYAVQIIASELTLKHELTETKAAVENYINQQGRKAAKFGGSFAAAAAVLSAAGFELATQGKAHTLIDNFRSHSTPAVGTSETLTTTSTSKVGIAKVLEHNGGSKQSITEYLNNGTPGRSDGTELGMNFHTDGAGGIVIDQNPGIANGNGVSVNLIESAKEGKLFAFLDASDGTSVKVPLNIVDGKIEAVIPKSSALHDLFTPKDGKWHFLGKSLHTGIATSENTNMSVAAVLGENTDGINVTETTQQIVQNIPTATPPQGVFPLTGVVPPPGPESIFNPRQEEQPDDDEEGLTGTKVKVRSETATENVVNDDLGSRNPVQPVTNSTPSQTDSASLVTQTSQDQKATEDVTTDEASGEKQPQAKSEVQTDIADQLTETNEALKVQAQPLNPDQIIEKLSRPDAKGSVIAIDNQKYRLVSFQNNSFQLEKVGADEADRFVTINEESLRQSLEEDRFRAEDFLGTNNAQEIIADLKDGEVFYDRDIRKHIKISRDPEDSNKFIFQEVEETSGAPELNKPHSVLFQSFLEDLTNGALSPPASRGVQLA